MQKIILACALLVAGCSEIVEGDSAGVSVTAGRYGSTNAGEDAAEHCSRYGKNASLLYHVGEDIYQFSCQ